VRAIHPDGFQPWLDVESRDLPATGGVRFESEALGRFDLSATYGRNRVESIVYNTNNVSLGTASPTSFDTGDLLYVQTNVGLDWSRPTRVPLLSAPVNVSAGLTFRTSDPPRTAGWRCATS